MTDPRDYCKHGTYVGGCGIDWVCDSCEMGDPDPTINEIKALIRHHYSELARKLQKNLLPFLLNPDPITTADRSIGILAAIWRWGVEPNQYAIEEYRRQMATASIWATSDDDADWLARRHDAALAGADAYYNPEED